MFCNDAQLKGVSSKKGGSKGQSKTAHTGVQCGASENPEVELIKGTCLGHINLETIKNVYRVH
jgi:hypothetical protein